MMIFASQEVDHHYVVQPTWTVRTSIVKADGSAGSSLVVAQTVRTEDLCPFLAKTSTRYGWGADESAALSLIRSM